MKIHRSVTLSAKHDAEIDALWNTEYPLKLKDRFALLLEDATLTIHFYVLNQEDEIIAWSVLFEKENDLRLFSLDESCRLNNEMIKAVLVRYQPRK